MKKTLSILSAAFLLCLVISCGNQDTKPVADTLRKDSTKINSGPHYGIDISVDQGDLLSSVTLPDSITFVICKATEGETYTDPEFSNNISLVKKQNRISGAYHFYHTADNPIVQADFFWNTIKNNPPDIAPILDIECLSFCEGASQCNTNGCLTPSSDSLQADLLAFLQELQKNSNRIPMIYASADFITSYMQNPKFASYPLWIADYENTTPAIPAPWTQADVWQKSGSFLLSGSQTEIDMDVYLNNFPGNK